AASSSGHAASPPRADLDERLFVSVRELIEDCAPGRVGDGAVHVGHPKMIGKPSLACKPGLAYRRCATSRDSRIGMSWIGTCTWLAHAVALIHDASSTSHAQLD